MKTKKNRKTLEFFAFVAPAMILILLISEIPFMMSIVYAFTKWNGVANEVKFIGLDNFIELFTDDSGIVKAAIFTGKYLLFGVIFTNIFALLLANILCKASRTKKILRTVFFLPNVLSMLIIAFMFGFVFTKGFDSLFLITGLKFFNWSWLGDIKLVFYSVGIISVWQRVGYIMLIYIAGIQSVPNEVIEAAIVDGANARQRFFKVLVPLIMPSVTISLFLTISYSLNVFDIPFALTKGGPGGATTGIPMNIYNEAFINNRFGYGAAKSIIYFIIVTVFTFIQIRITKSREVEA